MRLSHVMLYVSDIARAVEWYRRVLVFEPAYVAEGEFASLRQRVGGARLDLHRCRGPADRGSAAAVACFLSNTFDADVQALRAANVALGEIQVGLGPRHVIFRDCDGNALGLEEAGRQNASSG
jgi:catechol 2,3-dioxygenase-like lactoylglutathione lyase family enzyme